MASDSFTPKSTLGYPNFLDCTLTMDDELALRWAVIAEFRPLMFLFLLVMGGGGLIFF
jgi:hypothetical protein